MRGLRYLQFEEQRQGLDAQKLQKSHVFCSIRISVLCLLAMQERAVQLSYTAQLVKAFSCLRLEALLSGLERLTMTLHP